jgi:uncharacterized protein with HEPN domain
MYRNYKVYLKDILECIKKIRGYTEGLTKEEFLRDGKTVDAVVRNLEVIGEAVKHIPEEIREDGKYPDWRKVAGLRDVLIHAYFEVDLEVIWDVVQNKVSELEKKVQETLQET